MRIKSFKSLAVRAIHGPPGELKLGMAVPSHFQYSAWPSRKENVAPLLCRLPGGFHQALPMIGLTGSWVG